jgi:hypothetical protein
MRNSREKEETEVQVRGRKDRTEMVEESIRIVDPEIREPLKKDL